jgi:hypothetical protein
LDDCCRISLDRRGGIISYEPRTDQCGTCQAPSEDSGEPVLSYGYTCQSASLNAGLQTSSAQQLEDVDQMEWSVLSLIDD